MIDLDQSSNTDIRTMRPDDLEQVLEIDRDSFSLPWPASAYNYELNNKMSELWVAETREAGGESKVVGFVVVWFILNEAHIATIAVDANFRRQGIAKALLVTALIEIIRRGLRSVTLEVRASNFAAQRLYQGFLFKVVGNRARYYRDNYEDALIMTLDNLDLRYQSWLENGIWKTYNKASV